MAPRPPLQGKKKERKEGPWVEGLREPGGVQGQSQVVAPPPTEQAVGRHRGRRGEQLAQRMQGACFSCAAGKRP